MKKRYIIISSICAGALVITGAALGIYFGIKNKEDKRVLLSFGDIHATESRVIEVDKLAELTNAKENFLFVVSTTSCGCWTEFEPFLNNYLSSNKLVCYRIDFNNFKSSAAQFGLANISSSTTTFAIFENGEVKLTLNSSKDKNIMYDTQKFEKYMSQNVAQPGCYFITKDDVSTIKSSGKKAVIYFERSGCGDCSDLNPGLLRTYVKNHKDMKKLYVLDCQDYWRAKDAADYQSYLDFKNEMGLSIINNPTYGYGGGVFPFFSFIDNGQYASGSVIYNDSVTKQGDKYIVSESYYTSERASSLDYTNKVIQGLELSNDDVSEVEYQGNTFYSWKRESQDSHYKEILNSFLDYALAKQDFTF